MQAKQYGARAHRSSSRQRRHASCTVSSPPHATPHSRQRVPRKARLALPVVVRHALRTLGHEARAGNHAEAVRPNHHARHARQASVRVARSTHVAVGHAARRHRRRRRWRADRG